LRKVATDLRPSGVKESRLTHGGLVRSLVVQGADAGEQFVGGEGEVPNGVDLVQKQHQGRVFRYSVFGYWGIGVSSRRVSSTREVLADGGEIQDGDAVPGGAQAGGPSHPW
jgi:hypothetical protein